MLVHAGKYKTEDIKKTEITQIKYNPKKQTMQKIQQNKTLVQMPFTTLGQEMRWAYSTTLQSSCGAEIPNN